MRKIALHLAVFAAAAFAAPAAAWAFDCDSKVVDDAHRIAPGDMSTVNTAVQNLENQGAEVRVRTVVNFGGSGYANLDAYEHALMKFCPSWQSSNGHTKNNLVVFLLSYNTGDKIKAGLYYGETWTSQIGSQWPSLLSQQVGPMVRAGRHGTAVAKALDGIAGFIKPANVVQTPTQTAPQAPAGPSVVIDNRKPTNLAGLWYVLGGILLLALGVGIFLLLRSRRRDKEERQAAQQAAQAIKASCSAKIAEFDDAKLAVLEATINNAVAGVSEEDAKPLRDQLAKMRLTLGTATVQFNELQQAKNDPSFNDYSPQTYKNIEHAYQEVLDKVHRVETDKQTIEDGAVRLQKLAARVPTQVAEAAKAVSDAQASLKSVKDTGYKTPGADTKMTETATRLTEAQTALTDKRFTAAGKAADDAKRLAAVAVASAQAVPQRKAAVDASIAALKARIATATSAIETAKPVLAEILKGYAASNSTTVAGNCDLAVDEVATAQADVDKAAACAKMDKQDWDGAETFVTAAGGTLDRAESLARSVHALKKSLETARRDAPAEITTARTEIGKARTYIKENADGVAPEHVTELDAAEKRLKGIEADLKKAKPDYLEALASAKAAHAAADNILAAARSEHEAMALKRQKAASALRDAKAAVSKAKEYVEDHSGDVRKSARDTLASARRKLENAEEATDLDKICEQAGEAKTQADAALKAAQADYRSAEDERQEAARVARQREIDRQNELDAIAAAAAAATAAELAAANRRDTSNDFPSFGGGGGGGDSDGGGGSISIDTSSNDDGGGGSVSIDTGSSSDGGGGSVDI